MDEWLEEDEPAIVHARDPYHRVDVLDTSRHVRVSRQRRGGRRHHAREGDLRDRAAAALVHPARGRAAPSARRLGHAHRLRVQGLRLLQVACRPATRWRRTSSGSTPSRAREAAPIAGHLAFFNERVDLEVDGELQERPGHAVVAAGSITRGVSSASESSTTAASPSASAPADSPAAEPRSRACRAACAARIPFVESSTAAQAAGPDVEPPRGLEVDVRRRLAARHLLGGDGRGEQVPQAGELEHEVDQRPVRGGCDRRAATAPPAPRPPRGRAAAAAAARGSGVRGARRPRRAISSGSIATPSSSRMNRVHSGELMPIIRAWLSAVPGAAGLAGELAAHVRPDLLGVDQDAVHVEHHRRHGHAGDVTVSPMTTLPPPRGRASSASPPRSKAGCTRSRRRTFAWLQPNGDLGESNAGLIVGDGESTLVDTLWDVPLTRRMLAAMEPHTAPRRSPTWSTRTPTATTGGATSCCRMRGGSPRAPSAEVMATRPARPPSSSVSGSRGRRLLRAERLPLPAAVAGVFATSALRRRACSRPTTSPTVTPTPARPKPSTGVSSSRSAGGRVELILVGPAHTPGDRSCGSRMSRVVFAADVAFIGVTPVIWAGPLRNWLARARHDRGARARGRRARARPGLRRLPSSSRCGRYLRWLEASARPHFARRRLPLRGRRGDRDQRRLPAAGMGGLGCARADRDQLPHPPA